MLLTVCYIYLTYAYNKQKRSELSALIKMFCCHVPKASILIQRFVLSHSLGRMPRILKPGALSISGFCDDGIEAITLTTLMEKSGKQVIRVTSKQYVNLSRDWTLFIGSSTPIIKEYDQLTDQSEMYLLIEATPPYKDVNGRVHLRKVPPERAVKLSRLTKPIAWKSGDPYGIIVKASVEQCARAGLAFLEGVLELDDGLLVEHIATVGISGKGQSLLSRKASLHKAPDQNQLHFQSSVNHTDSTNGVNNHETSDSTRLMENQKNEEPSCHDPRSSDRRVPNVLVYTGSSDAEPDHYVMVKHVLQRCIHKDHYVIYHLTKTQILNHPWIDNTALLVLSPEHETHEPFEAHEKIKSFVTAGGTVLSFSSNLYLPDCINFRKHKLTKSIIEVEYFRSLSENTTLKYLLGDSFLEIKNCGSVENKTRVLGKCDDQPVILQVKQGDGNVILCQVRLDIDPTKQKSIDSEQFADLKKSNETRHNVLLDLFSRLGVVCAKEPAPSISPCYLRAKSESVKKCFLKTISNHQKKDGCLTSRLTDLQFVDDFPRDQHIDLGCIPVITNADSMVLNFDMEAYQNHLRSKVLGNVVLYSDVVTTTMDLFEGFMFNVEDNIGAVAIASVMTKGRGRGGNCWISPNGCAMFSVHVRVPIHSHIGQRLPYLQHIASTAAVEAVRSLKGYEEIDLRLKWPNDIYFGNMMKLGGVIVNSSCWENQFHAIIGCGFNVSNSDPTICINDLISRHNHEHGTNLLPLSRELLIARTLTCMERIIDDFQAYGKESFLQGYYKRWLHSGMKVRLQKEDGPEVNVVGLDDMGFLAVKDHSGQVISVQPDGNTFDMMKNLLVTKARP